ncbi:MAG: hypothetical protein AMJ66_07410 [Betaproteobacteria bacterium SG8_40]|nr:MAG: hypothetical protein AMJ66_07410 [Betaproteobacteria bacterium SG8_40]
MRRTSSLVALALAAGLQAGCGEFPQEARYEGGSYAGKPDTPAWQSEAFDGKRENWEREIKRRNKLQSEYMRPGGA